MMRYRSPSRVMNRSSSAPNAPTPIKLEVLQSVYRELFQRNLRAPKEVRPLLVKSQSVESYGPEEFLRDVNLLSELAVEYFCGYYFPRGCRPVQAYRVKRRTLARYYCAIALGYIEDKSPTVESHQEITAAFRVISSDFDSLRQYCSKFGLQQYEIYTPDRWLDPLDVVSLKKWISPHRLIADALQGEDLLGALKSGYHDSARSMAIATGHFRLDKEGLPKVDLASFRHAVWKVYAPSKTSEVKTESDSYRLFVKSIADQDNTGVAEKRGSAENPFLTANTRLLKSRLITSTHRDLGEFVQNCLMHYYNGSAEVNIAIKMGYSSDSLGAFRRAFSREASVSLAPLSRMITELERISFDSVQLTGERVLDSPRVTPMPIEEYSVHIQRQVVTSTIKRHKRSSTFRDEVLRWHGLECAVCSVKTKSLLEAAHVRPVADNGSDLVGNGLPLCPTHHEAFDQHLFCVEPDTMRLVLSPGSSSQELGITKAAITCSLGQENLEYRYLLYLRANEDA